MHTLRVVSGSEPASWLLLGTTALGGLIAVISGVVAERMRGRHEIRRDWRQEKRTLYAAYLGSCARAQQIYRSQQERAEALRTLDDLMGQMLLIAPRELIEKAEEMLDLLGNFYDPALNPRYATKEADWQRLREEFAALARADLDTPPDVA